MNNVRSVALKDKVNAIYFTTRVELETHDDQNLTQKGYIK